MPIVLVSEVRLLKWTLLAGVCGAAAYALAIIAPAPDALGTRGWVLVVVGAVLSLGAIVLSAREQIGRHRRLLDAESAAAAARKQLATTFQDALAPVAQHMARVAADTAPERRESLQAQSVSKVLAAAVQLADVNRARACWFDLVEGSPRTLIPRDHHGRDTGPTTEFTDGCGEGIDVFRMLDRGEGRYVADVDCAPPPDWDSNRKRTYKAFIRVPVGTSGRCFGMLTLDTTEPSDLSGDVVPSMKLLGHLLAVAMGMTRSAAVVDVRPDDERLEGQALGRAAG
ncbi:MAG: GAF domain-containing protein [Kineosporiaceae bacterium]